MYINCVISVPRTCEEYGGKGSGGGEDYEIGTYKIEPVKRYNEDRTFDVRCNFNKGQTIIDHNREEEVDITPCMGERCFELRVSYNTSMHDIETLMAVSEECHQDITFQWVFYFFKSLAFSFSF